MVASWAYSFSHPLETSKESSSRSCSRHAPDLAVVHIQWDLVPKVLAVPEAGALIGSRLLEAGRQWCLSCACAFLLKAGLKTHWQLLTAGTGHSQMRSVVAECHDRGWYAHICVVCIDFQPLTFTGLPTKGLTPSCGH